MRTLVGIVVIAVTSWGCGAQRNSPVACASTDRIFAGRHCLLGLNDGPLRAHAELIDSLVAATVRQAEAFLPLHSLRIILVPDPAGVIPEIGLGGFTPGADEIRIFVDPGRSEISSVLRNELPQLLAHELHHAARFGLRGYGETLFEAAISEGLADHFSIALTGRQPPPWSVALSGRELDEWISRILAEPQGPYDHECWFFGTDPSIPRWTGYSVGYELVRRALAETAGSSAAGWAGAEAALFRP